LDSTEYRTKHISEQKEIKDYCTSQFQASVTRGWVNSFILRHPDEIIQTKSVPQEWHLLQVSRMFLGRTVQNLNEHVLWCVTELVFNLNEVGISDWADRKTRKAIALATMHGEIIYHGISRIVKHISMIACISAAGESLTPYMITSQDPASVREQLKKHGVRFGTDCVLKSNTKPEIYAEIFLDYTWTGFSYHLAELRTTDEFTEEIGVLLMDNCPSHLTDHVIHLLTEAPVHVIAFAPHTTQIFQVLDVPLSCSQATTKIRIAFRRRKRDNSIHNENIACPVGLKHRRL
jgi:hypothetical protein